MQKESQFVRENGTHNCAFTPGFHVLHRTLITENKNIQFY